MTTKAIVTRRGATAQAMSRASERSAVESMNLAVEHELPHASLVRGNSEAELMALEQLGLRVKVLPDTNLIVLGSHRIDTEAAPPKLPKALTVPTARRDDWIHHLVQFIGPIQPEWVAALEQRGIDVVEPVGPYGVFVHAPTPAVSALRDLDFVAWTGLFQPAWRKHDNLDGLSGKIRFVSVGVYPESEVAAVVAAIDAGGGQVVRSSAPDEHNGRYTRIVAEVAAKSLDALAQQRGVRWLEYAQPEPGFDGERESQVLGESFNAGGTAPVPGYQATLAALGVNGNGVAIAVNDTGVDDNANNNTTGHLDLRGRMGAFVDYTGGGSPTDTQAHGTHVAGIAVGNAGSNQLEGAAPDNFQRGQGVAPASTYVVQNGLMGPWPPADWAPFVRDAVVNGARAQNNSWFSSGAGSGYTAAARQYDQLVRDPDNATPVLEHIGVVFSAGNAGGAPMTITGPKEAKNLIVVGNALNFRPGNGFPFDGWGVNGTSSRGPAVDGRTLPNVVAPGTDVLSATAGTDDQHVQMTGTSMAAPHVTGACALLVQWWRNRTGGKDPSAALLKALLINGAEDLGGALAGQNWFARGIAAGAGLKTISPVGFTPNAVVDQTGGAFGTLTQVASAAAVTAAGQWFYAAGTDTLTYRTTTSGAGRVYLRDAAGLPRVPNNHQGWGMVSLENMLLQAPASDRGPRIYSDQRHAFTTAGQEFTLRVAPVDPTRPLRVTLVWTDAAAAANANPALVNDLDLEVTQGANVWRGNVFANGFSATGGAFDNRNNVECVYLQNPSGVYEITVIASTIAASARPDIATPWQDFALVIENAEVPPAAPVSVVPVIDRSGSMIFYGYEAVTRAASKQFIDLLGVDDRYGLVSFGDSGVVEYPPAAPAALQTIVGQATRNAGKAEVDGVVFGGCTFMGDGIIKARDLLAGATTTDRAMVLFSDGYDNKGCDAANPAKPSALAAVGTLPAGLEVYTCAMGPTADQTLLSQIADATGGRYYFMPAIDDLFEIYNYIRGQVTGDSIVANESAFASQARVQAFVDASATEATFTVAWADRTMKFVPSVAQKPNELCVRLRDPQGRLLNAHETALRRVVGDGHVVFELQEPRPGLWTIEVSTAIERHTRFTAACFVRSPVRLQLAATLKVVVPGATFGVAMRAFDGKEPITGIRDKTTLNAPLMGVPSLLQKYKAQLANIRPPKLPKGDSMPKDIAQLMVLRDKLLQDGKPDLLARGVSALRMVAAKPNVLAGVGFAGPAVAGTQLGKVTPTESGSFNVVVQAAGTSSGGRWVRKEMISVLVK